MRIEIKSSFVNTALLSGEYESVKECLENNRGAYLGGADLRGADLGGADLRGADLCGADLRGAYLGGAYLGGADLRGADLCGAYLGGADLRGAYLCGADLCGADLCGANLEGIKCYSQSHAIFREAIRRQEVSLFVDAEWVAIAQITIHRLCGTTIKKRFGDVMPSIFTKLAEAGFDEWLKYWDEEVSK